jgi:hypothetical protein
MRTLYFTIVALSLSTTTTSAQQALLGPGAAYFAAGVSSIETRDLDDRLAARGYPTFGRRATTLGIGAYRIFASRLMFGGEANGLIVGEKTRGQRVVGLGGGFATLGVGYAMKTSPRVRVYPRFGLGVGGLGLWIETQADTVAFDDVLANPSRDPGRRPVLNRNGLVVDWGAGAELLPSDGGGPLIGLRVGYLAARFGADSNWQLADRIAIGGPAATIAGPYIRVVVGGAWTR